MNNYIIVIPARYNSSRFTGKPLVDVNGKSMIRRVWEKCVNATGLDKVIIATDDERIFKHCECFGMKVMFTSNNCLTGTDRLVEVAQKIKAEVYIHVQGDEPLISPSDIRAVINASQKHQRVIINAMWPINNKKDFKSPNIPKVVTRKDGRLLYMSRGAYQ